jgi:non-specific serine/threonine protein kinase/serine/threonine-protein kinase
VSQPDWSEVEEVMTAALDLEEEERTTYLARRCAHQPELRAEVESLLAADRRAGSFLQMDTGCFQPVLGQPISLVGRHLGSYKLLEVIGHGGMGTVYLAERTDGRFHKQVAIKVVPAALHSAELLRRFNSEQQILAKLEHPNIAHLLDAGMSSEGIPYLVMEYVAGTPVNEYCWTRHMSMHERLDLFRTICSAVHYAHQHLVIHRDLKPGNILVTNEGSPKLLDFGIAKLLTPINDSAQSVTHSMFNPMTPDYASPEQVRGEPLTTATDIYSLGVVLYELIAGQHPYTITGKPLAEAVAIICETEPERPGLVRRKRAKENGGQATLDSAFSSDLDAIVAKAMYKDPQQRYPSAQEFANDVSRYLTGLPVTAHHASFRYVTVRFISRHKLAAVALLITAVLAVTGVSAVMWQARVAQRERAKAEHRFDQLRSLAKSLMFEIHDSVKDLPGATTARQLLVGRATEYLDGLSREATGDVSLQRELAAAYERIGDVEDNPNFANLGDAAGAVASYRKAVTILDALLRADPVSTARKLELSGAYWKLGVCLHANMDISGALMNLQKAIGLVEQTGEAATNPAIADMLAGDYWAIAQVLRDSGDLDGALASCRKAALIRESVKGANAAQRVSLRTHVAGDYYVMGGVLSRLGRISAAAEAGRKSLAILQALADADPTNASLRQFLAGSHEFLGSCLEQQQLLDDALKSYREAQGIYRAASQSDPADTLSYRLVGKIKIDIGRVLVKKSHPMDALKVLQDALSIFRGLANRAPGSNYLPYNFGNLYSELGEAHAVAAVGSGLSIAQRLGHWREARAWYEKSLGVWLDLKRRGVLNGEETGEPDRIPKEILKCDAAIGRLERLAELRK